MAGEDSAFDEESLKKSPVRGAYIDMLQCIGYHCDLFEDQLSSSKSIADGI